MAGLGLALLIASYPNRVPASETPEVLVESEASALSAGWITSSDTSSLLSGVDSAQAGGVSGLPTIHGLADDRIRILVNGVPVAAACPMHMNPPLSYLDPSNAARIEILPGVTPVRLGGDSIAGTIEVESAAPSFAATDDSIEHAGQLSTYQRSNSSAYGGIAAAWMASKDFSVAYQGSAARAGDYRDGMGERINASRIAVGSICSKRKRPCKAFRTRDFRMPIWTCREMSLRFSMPAMQAIMPGATCISILTTTTFAMK
jgi:outer membrane receptor protein involved in Fe transport